MSEYNLGNRLRELRTLARLSQSGLEKKSGINRVYISKLENGEYKNPTYSTMLKLTSAMGFTLIDFFAKDYTPAVLTAQSNLSTLQIIKQLKDRETKLGVIADQIQQTANMLRTIKPLEVQSESPKLPNL